MKTSSTNPNELSSSVRLKAPGNKPKWVANVEWFCVFTIVFTGYLWFTSPVKTAAQSYFRLSLFTVGVVGYVLIQLLKWGRTRKAASR